MSTAGCPTKWVPNCLSACLVHSIFHCPKWVLPKRNSANLFLGQPAPCSGVLLWASVSPNTGGMRCKTTNEEGGFRGIHRKCMRLPTCFLPGGEKLWNCMAEGNSVLVTEVTYHRIFASTSETISWAGKKEGWGGTCVLGGGGGVKGLAASPSCWCPVLGRCTPVCCWSARSHWSGWSGCSGGKLAKLCRARWLWSPLWNFCTDQFRCRRRRHGTKTKAQNACTNVAEWWK